MSIESALEYIHSVKWQGSKPGLGRTRALLEALGNPQKGLKFVHVAGTNGKGSVCACMAAVLTRAGYVTGMYTSPHLVSFNERMQVDGVRVADGELEALTDEIRPYADAMADAPTEFEIITALAMCFFARKKCDIVVLEAGMGGELDSTNVIGPPEVAVITAIGMDHTSELGETVAEIATTKAGIIKPGCVAVIYGGQREAEEIVRSRCREVGAGMVTADFGRITILSSGMDAIRFSVSPDGGIDIPPIEFPLIGEYQPRNAALAITALECLRDRGYGKITGECIGDALSRVRWPGRFEIIMREPVFILDGAHNVHGIEATARSLEALFPGRGIIFVMGVMADKDVGAMADVIAPLADEIIATRPDYPRAMDAETLARLLRRRCRARVTACPDVTGAISFAYDRAGGRGGDGVVCALGSLYFSGEVRRAVSELAEIKRKRRRRRQDMRADGYRKRFEVEFTDTDFLHELKLSALFGMIQEAAGPASDSLGFGFELMRERFNAAWILTRIRADIARPAVWGDTITVETWNRRHSRATFERDFIVWGDRGERIAAAVTKWVVLDVETRAMLSASDFGFNVPDIDMPRAIDGGLGHMAVAADMPRAHDRLIGYSDIDANGHVNNARYVDFIMDCIPMRTHESHRAASVEVSYLSETRAGDLITLRSAADAPGGEDAGAVRDSNGEMIMVEGVRSEDRAGARGVPVFRARVAMVPRRL